MGRGCARSPENFEILFLKIPVVHFGAFLYASKVMRLQEGFQ